MSSQPRPVSLREQQRSLTRARLVEAAIDLFSDEGYSATSVADITAAAGATRATFYLHFKTKAEVALSILADLDRLYVGVFDDLVTVVANPSAAGIRAWLEASVGIWKSTRSASVAVNEAAGVETSLAQARARSFDHDIERVTVALRQSGRWTAGQAAVRAVLILTQLEQLFLRWSTRGGELDAGDAVDVLTSMWTAALGVDLD